MIVLYTKDRQHGAMLNRAKKMFETPDRAEAETARRRLQFAQGGPVLMIERDDLPVPPAVRA